MDTAADNPITILTPVPQLPLPGPEVPWPEEWPREFRLEPPGLLLRPMTNQIRRYLIDAAKEAGVYEKIHTEMTEPESQTVALLEVPDIGLRINEPLPIDALLFRIIGDGILHFLMDSYRVYGECPKPHMNYPWFVVNGTPDAPQWESVRIMLRTPPPQPEGEAAYPPKVLLDFHLFISKHWPRWSRLLGIEPLLQTFTDRRNWQGYRQAAVVKAQEAVAKYRSSIESADNPVPDVPGHLLAEWRIRGMTESYHEAARRAYQDQRFAPSKSRLRRSLQLFWDSFNLVEAYQRIILLTACLESLFSTGRQDIALQLKRKIGWLLYPENAEDRNNVAKEIAVIYGMRSKIVHGDHFVEEKAWNVVNDAVDLVRSIIRRIVEDDAFLALFLGSSKKKLDKALDNLAYGILPSGGRTNP